MEAIIQSSALQAYIVLALSGLASLYIAVARPTLSRRGRSGGRANPSPPATLHEAGTSPVLSSRALALIRGLLSLYIFSVGAAQFSRLGPYVFKFYTIWNWWLLGAYFALAAFASLLCAKVERKSGLALDDLKPGATDANTTKSTRSRSNTPAVSDLIAPQQIIARRDGGDSDDDNDAGGDHAAMGLSVLVPVRLCSATPLSRACHALFLINASTVIIVDVVCWGVLYPMLARGPQTPEIERIVRRLLLSFTSYNQHGLNALFIFADLFLNRHRLAFHAAGPLGLWSLAFGLWAHVWHAKTGKWLYPFLDTSKPWAPLAYLGLYGVHWGAFGLVAALYGIKGTMYGRRQWAGVSGTPAVEKSKTE